MSLLAVHKPGATVRLSGEALRVTLRGDILVTKPLHEITEVQLHGTADLEQAARRMLLKRGVDVIFFSGSGQYLGRLTGPMSAAGHRRLAQARYLTKPEHALELARWIVRGKLRHQRRLMLRHNRRRASQPLAAASVALRRLIARLDEAVDLDSLRGLEGRAAVLYFRGLDAAIVGDTFHFPRRSRRPPLDPFNACLSFGYTLLLTKVESALLKAGLDPYVGSLHSALRSAPALALDVMEPYRPFVDRLVLRLINRRQLHVHDFVNPNLCDTDRASLPEQSEPPSPAVHLGPGGRKIFLRAFTNELRVPLRYEPAQRSLPLVQIIGRQAYELSRLFEGEASDFRPFVPR